ncbi:hypothetical protein [Salinicola peritrichatus]|uniref:hypothetical protein n=1 Tax=Salinicola peritrichatus TaxID=1267424 RepID=UPI00195516D2|nr:hypothetical protein [Salinicola peritrichatus]
MKIAITAFKGEIPKVDPRLLPDSNAQAARNVDLDRGTVKSLPNVSTTDTVPDVANPTTLYRYPNGNDGEGFWFVWGMDKHVHIVRSPLANDEWERVYWTGDGFPKMAGIGQATAGSPPYPGNYYRLGIPEPNGAPTLSQPDDRDASEEIPDTALETTYAVTLVSGFGEEGPPTVSGTTILRWDMVDDAPAGGGVVVTLPGIPSGAQNIVTKRLYRVESGGVFQYVADVDASTATYRDDIFSEQLGIDLPSTEWQGPDDRMIGLTALPNGILAGYFGNTLCFSEAYRPHAWPVGYQLAMQHDIVAIASTSVGLVVLTEGKPVLVTGSSPEAMAQGELDVNQPCVAARSVVDMGAYALYASPDGLVAATGQDAQVVTANVMTKDQWQVLKPETIHAYRYDGKYLAFYDGGCFVFTPGEGVEFHDIQASGGYYDITDDTLYLIQDDDIVAWRQGSALPYRWRSKVFEVPPGGAGFTCAKVIAREYPITIRLFADGATMLETDVDGPGMFRLPSGYALSRDWEIEIAGTAEVNSVQIATSPSELT